MNMGDFVELCVIDINHEGQGVAKSDGFIYFIDGAVTGDRVKVRIDEIKKSFAICSVEEIIEKSSLRVESPCKYYPECGGCQLLELSYEEQIKIKKKRVVNDFKKSGINLDTVEVYDTIGVDGHDDGCVLRQYNYRNKTAFSVAEINGRIQVGTYEKKSHNLISIDKCLLQDEACDRIIAAVKEIFRKYRVKAYNSVSKAGNVRHIVIRKNNHKQIMLIIVTNNDTIENSKKICDELVAYVPEIKTIVQNINKKPGSQILGYKNITLYGDGTITDYIGELKFIISPHTFFQVNAEQTLKLYDKAIEYAELTENDTCFDMYCGIGTISLMAAKKAKKVVGVEIVEQSINDAKVNAENNGISNTEFFTGKVEDVLPRLYKKGYRADVIIVDPPRKGCEKEVLKTIADMKPKRVVYVSCNPATLARDVKLMEEYGYKLEKLQPVDMFANSVHVESVVLMSRKNK